MTLHDRMSIGGFRERYAKLSDDAKTVVDVLGDGVQRPTVGVVTFGAFADRHPDLLSASHGSLRAAGDELRATYDLTVCFTSGPKIPGGAMLVVAIDVADVICGLEAVA